MRFVMPFTAAGNETAVETLRLFAPHAEFIDVSADEEAYWRLFRSLWRAGRSFTLVEHDVEIHELVVPTLSDCTHDWCIFPFNGPNWTSPGGNRFTLSLGCTKFSDRLMDREPDLPDVLGTTTHGLRRHDWRRLDHLIAGELLKRGHGLANRSEWDITTPGPAVHSPPVKHHHVYDGVCACEAVHG